MTKHKPGETRAERKYRRLVEHNRKVITKHYHLDFEKAFKEDEKEFGEEVKRIISTFSDKEIEEANMLGNLIVKKRKPEDGLTYEEVAAALWGEKEKFFKSSEEFLQKQKEYRDNYHRSKVDRLLYVLQYLSFDLSFNTTIMKSKEEKEKERGDDGGILMLMIPCVKLTHKHNKGKDGGRREKILLTADKNKNKPAEIGDLQWC